MARSRRGLPVGMTVLLCVVTLAAATALTQSLGTRDILAVETAVPMRADSALTGNERLAPTVTVQIAHAAESVAGYFQRRDYRLQPVLTGADVPRLYLRELPRDLAEVEPIGRRKALFLRALLPIVLRENERLLHQRERLLRVYEALTAGETLDVAQADWLGALEAHFGTEPGDRAKLLRRLDEVPVSLALAQAALESAWGTSRFVREGNALYGMWTWSESVPGIVPLERPADASYRVRAFDSLEASVRAYVHTLNTHGAYADFRRQRERLRRAGRGPEGLLLAADVSLYSTERRAYTANLRALIRGNGLQLLDGAVLAGARPVLRAVADARP